MNDPAVDFVFDRVAPKLAALNIDHRINVLRCSQAARSVGDVIVASAARIKAMVEYLWDAMGRGHPPWQSVDAATAAP